MATREYSLWWSLVYETVLGHIIKGPAGSAPYTTWYVLWSLPLMGFIKMNEKEKTHMYSVYTYLEMLLFLNICVFTPKLVQILSKLSTPKRSCLNIHRAVVNTFHSIHRIHSHLA